MLAVTIEIGAEVIASFDPNVVSRHLTMATTKILSEPSSVKGHQPDLQLTLEKTLTNIIKTFSPELELSLAISQNELFIAVYSDTLPQPTIH